MNDSTWRDSEHLLWDISSQLRVLNAGIANLFRGKGKSEISPSFLPRPGEEQDVGEALDAEQARDELSDLMDGMVAAPDN